MRHTSQIYLSPFGSSISTRGIGSYRYGLNGMEMDNEIKGGGNSYTTEFRQHDPRLGRWFSRDLIVKYWESPYAVNHNNPIYFIDPLGLDPEEKWGWLRRAFAAKYKCDANDFASKNNIDEKFVNYNCKNQNTGQKFATIKTSGTNKVSEFLNASITIKDDGSKEISYIITLSTGNKSFYDGGEKLKERPVAWFDRLHNNMVGRSDGSINASWYPDFLREGHSDPVLSAPNASGGLYQFGGTASGFNGGLFIGMSRSDGFNLGIYGGGDL